MDAHAQPGSTPQTPAPRAGGSPLAGRGKSGPAPLVVKSDLVTATALIGCAALACLPDRTWQSALCRSIAKTHIGLRGSRADSLRSIIPLLDTPISAAALEVALLADEYDAVAETWRDHLPWCRPVTGRLGGAVHLEAALAAGRGAVLWVCASGPGSRVALRCLAGAGYKLVALRDHAHPYSPSRLCRAVMNPIPNHADDRHLESVVIAQDNDPTQPLQALGTQLAGNKPVLVTADGAFGERHERPFFGGTLRLGLGAPALALREDAPLLPLFCVADGTGGYDLTVEAPLGGGLEKDGGQAARQMADRYAEILARYLKSHPRIWENWFAPDTWSPG